jgi:hypothetical protein
MLRGARLARLGARLGARRAGIGALAGVLLMCACSPGAAQAGQSARLHVGLRPERLGAGTTIAFGFQIEAAGGALPGALTLLDVRLPPGMGIDTAGLATCAQAMLTHGPRGCSANAQVGTGSVKVQVPLGNVIRPEIAALTVFNGPRQDGHTTLLFYAAGKLPIATQLIFTGVIVPGPLGQRIEASIPLIPTLPNTPDAAIVEMTASLGTRRHTYYRTIGHRRVHLTPKGVTLPGRCPAGGFPFSAEFHFNDGSSAEAGTTVGCPG